VDLNKYLIVPGVTGFAAENEGEFVDTVRKLLAEPQRLRTMAKRRAKTLWRHPRTPPWK
jgi:hypothetical protein